MMEWEQARKRGKERRYVNTEEEGIGAQDVGISVVWCSDQRCLFPFSCHRAYFVAVYLLMTKVIIVQHCSL